MKSDQSPFSGGSPLDPEKLADLYFLEHRAKLLDVAAFLDRIDRADSQSGEDDFRVAALRDACRLLTDSQSQRTRRMLELFSDHTGEIPQSANGLKGASGAVRENTANKSGS